MGSKRLDDYEGRRAEARRCCEVAFPERIVLGDVAEGRGALRPRLACPASTTVVANMSRELAERVVQWVRQEYKIGDHQVC